MYVIIEYIEHKMLFIDSLESFDDYKQYLKTKRKSELVIKVASVEDFMIQLKAHNSKKPAKFQKVERRQSSFEKWDYNKISNPSLLLQLWNEKNYKEIFKMHNEEKWSSAFYCCDGYSKTVDLNMKDYVGY